MGINLFHAEMIVREHLYRPLPETIYLIGRQTVLFNKETALALLDRYNITPAKTDIELNATILGVKGVSSKGYITDAAFFQMLGVKKIKAIDHSDYEGADIIIDLNRPLPHSLKNKADFVFGGSVLDNIFDPATYVKNVACLLRPGGRLMDQNICGFYNHPYVLVSPAWYYDYFVSNRFADCKLYFIETGSIMHVYGLDVGIDDSLIGDFGNSSISNYFSIVLIAEKAKDSTWEVMPSQDQYRREKEWKHYRLFHARLKQASRPHVTFSTPTPLQLERQPLRRVKAFPYLGCYVPFAQTDYVRGEEQKLSDFVDGGIRVVEATYGWNNQREAMQAPSVFPLCRGNVTDRLAGMINGSESCEITLDVQWLGDPAPGLPKDFRLLYYYASDPDRKLMEIYIPAEAHGKKLTILSFMQAIQTLQDQNACMEKDKQLKSALSPLSYMHNEEFVFVYQMGKVGSTALCRSLDKMGWKYCHCQWLREETFKLLKWDLAIKQKGDDYYFRVITYNHYQNLKYHLLQLGLKNVVRIITFCREPVSHFLSYFFHGNAQKELIRQKYGYFNSETIITYILECFHWVLKHKYETLSSIAKNVNHYPGDCQFAWYLVCNPLRWFDDELLHHFDIDVYSEPFGANGWVLLDNRILVLKFEKIGEDLDRVIGNFLQRPGFKMLKANRGEDKDYADMYQEVKSKIKFDKEILDFVYDTRYSRHFYSDSEINEFYKRWEK